MTTCRVALHARLGHNCGPTKCGLLESGGTSKNSRVNNCNHNDGRTTVEKIYERSSVPVVRDKLWSSWVWVRAPQATL